MNSTLVDRLHDALIDEVYDGASGALTDHQFTALVRKLAETAAAVFEKAHTPTDVEREALRTEAERVQRAAWAEIHGQDPARTYSVAEVKQLVYSFDNVLSSALRRSEAADPRLCLTAHPITGARCSLPVGPPHAHVCDLPPEPQGEPSDAHFEFHETRRLDGSWWFTHRLECFCEKRENHWSLDRSKLLDAANAYMHYEPPYGDLSAFSDQFLNDMYAALRAASEVGGA